MSEGLFISGLRVVRGGREVIHGVDLEIAPGRITALLGANGAGKSSLVLAVAGALPTQFGVVSIDGEPITGLRPENVRRKGVAAVPEGHHVLTDLTVAENLSVAGYHLQRAKRDAGIEAALETFPELRAKLTSRAGSLSGGQQQMLVLAQAIVDRPVICWPTNCPSGLLPSSWRGSYRW